MNSDILRNYEQQFGILCADITSKISKSVHFAGSAAEKKSLCNTIEGLFGDAREIIEQMELEARDISAKSPSPEQHREKYMNIINGYRRELTKLESEFNKQIKLKKSEGELRAELMGAEGGSSKAGGALDDEDEDHVELNSLRDQNKASVQKMSNNLESGYRMVLESEETGRTILSDLFSQRETMERGRDRLRNTNVNLGKSSRLAGEMMRRLLQNKLALVGMCVLLLLFVVLIIYLAIRKKLNHE